MSASRIGWCIVLAATVFALFGVAEQARAQSVYYYDDLWYSYRYGVPYYYYDPWYYSYSYYPWYSYYYDPSMTTGTTGNTGTIQGPNQTPLTSRIQTQTYVGQSSKEYMAGAPTKCTLYTGASAGGFTPAARVHDIPKSTTDQNQQGSGTLGYQNFQNTNNRGNQSGTTWSYFGQQVVGADLTYWQGLSPLYNNTNNNGNVLGANNTSTGRGAAPDNGAVQKQTPSGVITYTPGPEVETRYNGSSYAYSRFADPRRSLPEPKKKEPRQATDDADETADVAGKTASADTKATTGTKDGSGGTVAAAKVKTVQPSSVRTVQPNVSAAPVRTVQPNVAGAKDFRSRRNR